MLTDLQFASGRGLNRKFKSIAPLQNRLRTREILAELLNSVPASDSEVKESAESVVLKMLEHNPTFDPDTLARAIFFYVCEKEDGVTTETVRRIRKNGVSENTSWPRLLDTINSVVSK